MYRKHERGRERERGEGEREGIRESDTKRVLMCLEAGFRTSHCTNLKSPIQKMILTVTLFFSFFLYSPFYLPCCTPFILCWLSFHTRDVYVCVNEIHILLQFQIKTSLMVIIFSCLSFISFIYFSSFHEI
jgi:hypothetical protein